MRELLPLIRCQMRRAWRICPSVAKRWDIGFSYLVLTGVFFINSLRSKSLQDGTIFFGFMLFLLAIPLIYEAIQVTADMLVEESRPGTYELMFVSGLRPMEIILSKLIGTGLISGRQALFALPFLTVTLSGGGVSWWTFVVTLLFLPLVFFFVLALGLFCSAISKDESGARTRSWVILILSWLIPGLVSDSGLTFFKALSPVYSLVNLMFEGVTSSNWFLFVINGGLMVFYCIWLLRHTASAIEQRWHANQQERRAIYQPWLRYLTMDSTQWREELKVSPTRWLGGFDVRPVWLGWSLAIGLGLLSLEALFRSEPSLNKSVLLLALFSLISFGYIVVNCYAVARRLHRDKADGQLEVLLCTPLTSSELLVGLKEGVARRLRRLLQFLYIIAGVALLGGLIMLSWNWAAALVYTLLWATLGFILRMLAVQIYYSTLKQLFRSEKALNATLGAAQPYLPVWFGLWCITFILVPSSWPTGSDKELTITLLSSLVILSTSEALRRRFAGRIKSFIDLREFAQR